MIDWYGYKCSFVVQVLRFTNHILPLSWFRKFTNMETDDLVSNWNVESTNVTDQNSLVQKTSGTVIRFCIKIVKTIAEYVGHLLWDSIWTLYKSTSIRIRRHGHLKNSKNVTDSFVFPNKCVKLLNFDTFLQLRKMYLNFITNVWDFFYMQCISGGTSLSVCFRTTCVKGDWILEKNRI